MSFATAIRGIVGDGPVYVATGLVTGVRLDDDRGVMLVLELLDGRTGVEARPVWLGANGHGVFDTIERDTEALVLFPGGDANAAVALCGVSSEPQRPPDGWDNTQMWIVHDEAVVVARSDTKEVEGVVLRPFLDDLSAWLQAVIGALAGMSSTFTTMQTNSVGPTVAYADDFGTLVSTTADLASDASTLKEAVDASRQGVGAAPHTSGLLRTVAG